LGWALLDTTLSDGVINLVEFKEVDLDSEDVVNRSCRVSGDSQSVDKSGCSSEEIDAEVLIDELT
jgi:hypothetical protein